MERCLYGWPQINQLRKILLLYFFFDIEIYFLYILRDGGKTVKLITKNNINRIRFKIAVFKGIVANSYKCRL